MLLTEKEMSVLKDLQTQEKNCIDKYEKYAGLAKDDDTYKTLQDYLKTYNYEISTVVTDCLAGKKTVEQVFITDGGVIS